MPTMTLEKINKLSLVAFDDESQAVVDSIAKGEGLELSFRKIRNLKNHKRFFKFIQIAFDMQEHFQDVTQFRRWLTMKAGYFNCYKAPNGTALYEPKSLAFDSMEEPDFRKVFNACIDTFLKEFAIRMTHEQLEQIVEFGS